MKTHYSDNYSQTGAFYRLVDAMRRSKKGQRRFAVFIGAGCSLSSSNKDIGIEQVILDSIRQGFDFNYKYTGSWEQLYRDFVNYVWSPRNESDRKELLNDSFLNLKPGAGYKNLRLLIENGYITDIITTNFDMLIDDSLSGLSYNVKVGTNPIRTVKGGSPVFLIKIHGDIENGELRFSPSELENLPESISTIIADLTDHSCLVCGYRGQDIGVMKSLCKNSSYSVFWADPKKPIKDNIYESQKIYEWMEARKSESNFIFGDLGKFDELMIQLVKELLDVRPFKIEHIFWQNSSIVSALLINRKVYQIFSDILYCSDIISEDYGWNKNFPFFADSYKKILKAFLHYYQRSENNTEKFFKYPENEIEALLLGVSLEVMARVEGLTVSRTEYVKKLKTKFLEKNPYYRPDQYFWIALNKILDNTLVDNSESDIPHIQLSLSEKGMLIFSVYEPQIGYLIDIINNIYICAMFLPTCENVDNTNQQIKNKLLLQLAGEYCEIQQDKITFHLGSLTSVELNELYDMYFKKHNFIYNEKNMIINTNINILADVKESDYIIDIASSLYEYIVKISQHYTNQFINNKTIYEVFDVEYVTTLLSTELNVFLASNKKCMFLIGVSGSGKTMAIKNFANAYLNNDNYLIYVFSPKYNDNNFYGLQAFFPDLLQTNYTNHDIIINISKTLKVRNCSLILVFEGINEICTGFKSSCNHYRGLYEIINLLHDNDIENIKLIVTCRDQIFNDYCSETGLYPEPELCYCSSVDDKIYPYYKIPELSAEYQQKLAMVYFNDQQILKNFLDELNNNIFIRNTFNQPYLIALASKFWKSNNNFFSFSLHNIFSSFTKQMIKNIGKKSDVSLAYDIINKYFEILLKTNPFNRRISKFMITNMFDEICKKNQVLYVLNQLCDANILSSLQSNNYIRFSHDRIEEHLLTEFFNVINNNSDLLCSAINLSNQDEIIYSALQNYFACCIMDKQYSAILPNIDYWYGINSDTVPSLFAGSIGNLDKEILIELFYYVKFNDLDIKRILNIIVIGMKENISGVMVNNPDLFFENYDLLIKLFPDTKLFAQDIFFIASKYYFLQRNNLELADHYCDLAAKQMHCESRDLTYAVKLQKAIFLKTKGAIEESISIFEYLYPKFVEMDEWENAAECIFEWGGALREKTKFEEALIVYNKINLDVLENYPIIYAKIVRRIGTIYKNQMQQILKDVTIKNNNLPKNEFIVAEALYYKANECFERAYKKISKTRNIIEKLKILSEETENALRITPFLPEQRYKAEYSHSEEAKLLAIIPVPDRKCLYLRECAIFNEIDGKYTLAIGNLIEARNIANTYSLFYREFEANYQLAHLIENHWESLSQENRTLGIDAVNKALDFNLLEDNIYMINCKNVKNRLIQKNKAN